MLLNAALVSRYILLEVPLPVLNNLLVLKNGHSYPMPVWSLRDLPGIKKGISSLLTLDVNTAIDPGRLSSKNF